ncbi:cytochrome c-type protein NrfH [Sporomusaceae bacterium FL31]|nr:cytochrome c-type protein NrfH [Sporomusaceae bacterium FL31]GCE33782.1 cytochrome c-type protein NrfH [Sporomusaceae bacterium]
MAYGMVMLLDKSTFWSANAIKLILLGVVGAVIGMLIFGAGLSYADNPSFCGSCHSMQHVYATWQESNHQSFSCGDCHLPHNNIFAKLYVKGENGMRHTYHEVMRDYPNTIEFTTTAATIANKNCLRCHAYVVGNTALSHGDGDCISCHRGLPHGRGDTKGGGVKVE